MPASHSSVCQASVEAVAYLLDKLAEVQVLMMLPLHLVGSPNRHVTFAVCVSGHVESLQANGLFSSILHIQSCQMHICCGFGQRWLPGHTIGADVRSIACLLRFCVQLHLLDQAVSFAKQAVNDADGPVQYQWLSVQLQAVLEPHSGQRVQQCIWQAEKLDCAGAACLSGPADPECRLHAAAV